MEKLTGLARLWPAGGLSQRRAEAARLLCSVSAAPVFVVI